jgi:adenine-specific DNA-methyltransferase
MPTTEKLRNKLMAKLTELFQLDQPDLDFGFYRIMQAKAQQVKSFIDKDLLQIIEDAFGQVDEGRKTELTAAYENVVREAREEYGAAEPEKTPKAIKAKAALDALRDGATAESDVYDHLYRFFERYYDEGDFISRRYYARENAGKAAPFAIPYNGEEVKLHWANADQYYIKTAEYFSNYSFDITQAAEIRKMSDGEKVLNGIPEKTLKVHFRIVDASEGEHGNVKAAEDKKRFFILHEENPIEFNETQELVINFEYKALPGGKNAVDADTEKALKEKFGKSLNKGDMPNLAIAARVIEALETTDGHRWTRISKDGEKICVNLCESVVKNYLTVLRFAAPTDKISNRPLLAKYINQYTARNTMDYFIHKNLGAFLKRELDFYIKNEMMHLDDIENADAPAVENYLAKLKVIRKIATKLIDFLAQLEDFQKKLWLKKKFVTETNYCITLDRIFSMENGELTIDNEGKWLLEQIANNDAQIQEWIKLSFIEDNEIEDLKKWMQGIIDNGKLTMDNGDTDLFGNPDPKLSTIHSPFSIHLVLDTAFFSSDFKAKLIASIEDFDEQCDGLLIHSENFQALNLLQERYREQVKCVYIDPPYNTGGDDFLYKDSYQHSSWLSLITDRLVSSEKLIQECGSIAVSIDLKEFDKTISLLDTVFSEESRKNLITVKRGSATGAKVINPGTINISEFVLSYSKNPKEWAPEKAYRQKAYDNRYGTIIINFEEPFANWEFESVLDAFSNYYELPKSQLKKHFGLEYEEKLQSFVVENAHRIIQFVSLDENSVSQDAVTLKKQSLKNRDKIFHLERDGKNDYYIRNGKAIIFYKDRLIQIGESLVPGEPVSDIWDDVLPNDLHNEGGVNLRKGKKPEKLIHRLIEMGSRENELVMDFFMGSGTTGAVSFKSKRKWLGIEYSDYFDVVTLKRLKLTLFGDKSGVSEMTMWKGGGCFKYLRLESYEDTLNNLEFDKIPARDKVMEQNDSLREDYMLHYMLDVETRGSQSLLNIDNFANPTAYTLKVKKPGSDEQVTQNIDLIETFNYLLGLRLENMAAPQTFTAGFTRKPDPELPEDQHTKLVVDGQIKQVNHRFTQIDTDKEQEKNNPCSSVSICGSKEKIWWFRKLEGWVPADPMNPNNGQKERVLIVWRKLTGNLEEDNLMLDEWFEKYRISTHDFEYDTIYVNGSNNLPNLKKDDENWKVRLIEEEFHKRMWEME